MTSVALTIAGSDPSGGAGVQADLKTFQRFGVYGMAALTALTAQNTTGVLGVHVVPADFLAAQLDALARDIAPHAVKTGMLATAELVRVASAAVREYGWHSLVVDPVMVATSGARLLSDDAEQVILQELVPLAALVTPNLDEAALLVRRPVTTPDEMEAAARLLLETGAGAALVKGGHLPGDRVVDVLATRDGVRRLEHPRIVTTSTHGTGCTLSAAIAAGLAQGRPLEQAVESALDYVARAIATAPGLGRGHGPVNHSA
jgi:hydroxymethylpyrimidine/phosphomethylpyrimidine kinase